MPILSNSGPRILSMGMQYQNFDNYFDENIFLIQKYLYNLHVKIVYKK
jgi:hypothetical protein